MPFATVAAAIATFTSQNKGAEQYDRIRQGVYQANMLTTIYSIVVTILIFLSAPFLVHVMSGSSDPVSYTHLDVYKRQGGTRVPVRGPYGSRLIATPASS